MSRTALLAGASGLVGSFLLRRLLDDARYSSVRVLTRRPLQQTHARLQMLITDFSDLGKIGAQLRTDDVYCCLGTTLRKAGSKAAFEQVDYHLVVNLAHAAKQAGAKRFIVISAAGSAAHSPSFYSQVKARMEREVSAAGFDSTQILRPSLLLGARDERRLGERIAQVATPWLAPLMLGSLKKYRPVEADDVAAAMITLAWRQSSGAQIHHLPLD